MQLDEAQIKHMVERFLRWKLPENFNPDGGISFQRMFNEHTAHPMKHEPVGTNLLDYNQAKEMVLHMLEGLPVQAVQPVPVVTDEIASTIGYHLASIVSGNNQPCMSGDPRDRIQPARRRHFDQACYAAAEAITTALSAPQPGAMPSDAEINALIERLSQFEGRDWETTACYNGLRLEAAAFLAALRDERDILADRIRVLDPLLKERCDEAQNFYERADKAEARVRELEQKLERARVALAETTEWLDDASHPYIPGTASAEGWNAEREARLNRARAALAEIGQRG